jgi:hypothetical protein
MFSRCCKAPRFLPGSMRQSLSLLLLFFFLLLGCSRAPQPPHLVVPQEVVHLGEGKPGEELTKSVPLRNAGGDILRIDKVEADCSCSSLRFTKETIAPGQETLLIVRVRIKEGENNAIPVRIVTNDPTTPEAVFFVRADAVQPPLRTDPPQVDFGEVPAGTSPLLDFMPFKLFLTLCWIVSCGTPTAGCASHMQPPSPDQRSPLWCSAVYLSHSDIASLRQVNAPHERDVGTACGSAPSPGASVTLSVAFLGWQVRCTRGS